MKKLKQQKSLKNKSILLGICGSIAVSKMPDMINKLIERGARVRIIITLSAKKLLTNDEFIQLKKLVNGEVYEDLFEKNNEMSHINLTRESDLFIITPISAHSIEKIANGRADDLLSATVLASNQKIMLAPAMNHKMYQNPILQKNLTTLKNQKQFILIEPDIGKLACGEYGVGRLVNSDVLIHKIEHYFSKKRLQNKKVLITVGATIEAIDPVRFISNFSSGKMGFAIAESFIDLGAKVVLIHAKTDISPPPNAKVIKALSANQMLDCCLAEINLLAKKNDDFDYFVATAAVSDYRVKNISEQKMKKKHDEMILQLVKNKDILKHISLLKNNRPKKVIGFAAETEFLKTNAIKKIKEKKLDFIAANLVGKNKAFAQDTNELVVISRFGDDFKTTLIAQDDKRVIAKKLVDLITK